jgi:anti-sigma factor RsiW
MNPELDERLSALLDGELPPAEAAALRAEIARSPELAARLAALAAVDDGVRALPSRPVPVDLRARLAARLEAASARTPDAARHTPRRAVRRWLAAAALAAAAAALALLALPRAQREEARIAETPPVPAPPEAVAPSIPVAPPAPAPAPAPAPRIEIAQEPPPAPEPLAAEELAEAEDLPVIQVLDVLAELDELEEVGSG